MPARVRAAIAFRFLEGTDEAAVLGITDDVTSGYAVCLVVKLFPTGIDDLLHSGLIVDGFSHFSGNLVRTVDLTLLRWKLSEQFFQEGCCKELVP